MTAQLCPRFHKAIELVGSRWTGAVLQVLLGGRKRFSEVRDAVPDISDRMLSERLHVLEAEGLVARTVMPDPPIRVEYELTRKGQELQATLVALARWAEQWIKPDEVETKPARRATERPRRLPPPASAEPRRTRARTSR